MAKAADTPAGEIARGRGGFYRSETGAPYVTDPNDATVKSGKRKGEPKRIPYGAPSSRGKQIENTHNLQKWSERRVVRGIGIDLALIADCAVVARLDPESQEYKDAADRVVLRARAAAEAMLAADRGSHSHALSEDYDEERDWIARAEAGEDLGLGREVQASLVEAWRVMLEREGLEILAVEASCVDDRWHLAGTLDRIARTTKLLRFALVTGEVVEVPPDTVLVLDIKSGKRKARPDGSLLYWQAYGIQVASYAQSVPYDTETETRSEWPWVIDQTHALIAHLDVLGALDGNPSCELVWMDLQSSREHGGETVVAARAWESRRDVFSVAQLASPEVDASTGDAPAEGEPAVAPSAELDGTGPAPGVDDARGTQQGLRRGTSGVPLALSPAEQLAALTAGPDEGGPADPAAVAALERRYEALGPAARSWLRDRVIEAQQHGVSLHLKGNHTLRRFELVRGLVAVADTEQNEDETLRCVVATILGDVAHFPAVTLGHLVGSLTAAEAATFATRCTALVETEVPAVVDEAGRVHLQFDVEQFEGAA